MPGNDLSSKRNRSFETPQGYFSADELFASDDAEPTERLHLAFQARDRETVDAFYEAALAAGGRDNGA